MLKGCYDGVRYPKQADVRRSYQGLVRSARRSSLTQTWDDGGTPRLP